MRDSPDLLTKEQRQRAIDDIIRYFSSERGETVGVIAAQQCLDSVLQSIEGFIYNAAIDDARKAIQESLYDFDFKLSELKRE